MGTATVENEALNFTLALAIFKAPSRLKYAGAIGKGKFKKRSST